MQFVFDPLLYKAVLVWIDDVILFAKTAEEFLQALRKFFELLREFNLKLNIMKSKLFQLQAKWRGRFISGDDVAHDPERVDALRALPLPETAGDLQYFLCAANWLRDSIVDFARHAAPLQATLDAALKGTSRRRQQALRIPLVWSDDEKSAYTMMLERIGASTPLAFPDPGQQICVFSDASDVGGMFRDSQTNWSIVEKEAFPIVQACTTLEYLLQRANGFRLYCDHANLIAIFAPDKELKRHVNAKLQRWVMRLTGYIYTIEHIPGANSLWADIVSRWWHVRDGSQSVKKINFVRTRSAHEISQLRPLEDSAFDWPSNESLADAQQRHVRSAPPDHTVVDDLVCVDGKPWIPAAAKRLLARILVVAHAGSQGHRGEQAMLNAMRRFALDEVTGIIKRFVRTCLLCKHVKGPHVIQRPWGPTLKCSRRNEVLHWDFLSLTPSHGDLRYVLVLKDDLTHFCELVACSSPTAFVAAEAITDWYKRFGSPETWQSDCGTHFRNSVLNLLSSRLKSKQGFTPPYSPWVNGTVERVNRDVLQVLRVLLMKYQLDTKEWPYLLPVVQANLNHTELPSLGDKAPVELFTGLPPTSALDVIWNPHRSHDDEPIAVDLSKPAIVKRIDELRRSLQECTKRLRTYVSAVNYSKWQQRKGPHATFRKETLFYGLEWMLDYQGINSCLDITEEMMHHVSNQGLLLNVERFCGARYNDELSRWELEVSWQGLEDAENSYEGLEELFNDVPAKVAEYVAESSSDGLRAAVAALQDIPERLASSSNRDQHSVAPHQHSAANCWGKQHSVIDMHSGSPERLPSGTGPHPGALHIEDEQRGLNRLG
ncbi:hypothetical protein ON010_g7157 [Phytophthora cinnamomi]|nr:hypothetical protein ON010_g7157 [Phytophthora cinnamomi]